MKVFYVMVLVLVAGAVPSHGRTESEGTVFNKTQPYESMNNVTVSSSKLVEYNYLYLAMQWPRSFCNFFTTANRQCYQRVPDRFTVHGLWPQKFGGPIDCRNRRKYGRYPRFNSRQLPRNLVSGLNKYWLDLTSSVNNNHYFWETEYNKHGSCTFNNQNDYFGLTLTLVEQLEYPISRLLREQRIIPGVNYSHDDFKAAVQSVNLHRPRLRCIEVRNINQLLEIRFCAVKINNVLSLTDCPRHPDCRNQLFVLPPVRPLRP